MDAPNLAEEAVDEPEVAAGDAGDGCDGHALGEVVAADELGGRGEPHWPLSSCLKFHVSQALESLGDILIDWYPSKGEF